MTDLFDLSLTSLCMFPLCMLACSPMVTCMIKPYSCHGSGLVITMSNTCYNYMEVVATCLTPHVIAAAVTTCDHAGHSLADRRFHVNSVGSIERSVCF